MKMTFKMINNRRLIFKIDVLYSITVSMSTHMF